MVQMDTFPMQWGSMAYFDSGGSGPPAVLLHGTGCDAGDWRATIGALPATIRVLAPDFRGHGKSSASSDPLTLQDLATDVLALLERLGLERVVLAGHSLGGMVAMEVANRSTRVAALVLLEGWPRLDCAQAFSGNRMYGTLDGGAVARIAAKYAVMLDRFPPDKWRDFWSSVDAFDGMPFLSSATIPILAAFGDLGRTKATLRVLDLPDNPSIHLRWVAGAGHYLPHEQPAEVSALIAEAISLPHRA
jgi:pimeloyl-ACP methyl ester carboxylesterase